MSVNRVVTSAVLVCAVFMFVVSGAGVAHSVTGEPRRSSSPVRVRRTPRVRAPRLVITTADAGETTTGERTSTASAESTLAISGSGPTTSTPATVTSVTSATSSSATGMAAAVSSAAEPVPVEPATAAPAPPLAPGDPVWITPPAATSGTGRPGPATTVWVATATTAPVRGAGRCLVFLHGKDGAAATRSVRDGVVRLAPGGNAASASGAAGTLQWNYATAADYTAARAVIDTAMTGESCGQLVIAGFSNGGALAAKLLCRGETFGGRLIAMVLEDPVPDQVVNACAPGGGVRSRLVQSDWMNTVAGSGRSCPTNWICEGSLMSLASYAAQVAPLSTDRVAVHNPVDDVAYAATLWAP